MPAMLGTIDACGLFKPGVPSPSHLMMRLVQIDIQVDPLALRRDFKFLVEFDVAKVRTDEDLGHIPVPQFVRLLAGSWCRLKVKLVVRTDE